jgi:hypothetical protein
MNSHLISYAVTALVVLGVLAFRFMRSRTARPMRIEYLWVIPAIYVVIGALGIGSLAYAYGISTTPADLAIMAACLVGGALLGWWRGKLMRIDVHPETHVVMMQPSPWALLVIGALILVRLGLRALFLQQASPAETTTITADLILAAVGILGVARIEMWMRASKLLAEAQAKSAA